LEAKRHYTVVGEPEDLTGAESLASYDRYQFQWWALSLMHARPYGDKKKGSDTGIDGFLYFQDEDKKYKRAIVQVKSGNVKVGDIRDLGHVIDRENSEIGIFITLKEPTRPMKEEAVAKGFYRSEGWNRDYPRIQILTIEELLAGKEPDIPHPMQYHKQAERAETKDQHTFDFE
jgi:site-specific DNA-methyltransferase (adenine-specific)